ncbi:hypothetical protein C1645_834274 [Glomus cerebriforme]|uniref:RNase H type-1 domain-containing protein n=1 Tax=Glomus cerebriforme TaxID=658196 RepID=A0A397SFW8_9GLOM|nr:hypothetical protein C1645_834274 [Glomus cerebriforme]
MQEPFNTDITKYFPNFTLQDISSLRNKRIIFTEQVTTKDGLYLRPYKDTEAINYQGSTPNWYKKLLLDYTTKIWTSYWDPSLNTALIGCIIEIYNPSHGISTAYVEHWIYSPLEQDRFVNTPKKLVPIFTRVQDAKNTLIITETSAPNVQKNISTNLIPVSDTPYSTPSTIQNELPTTIIPPITDPIISNNFLDGSVKHLTTQNCRIGFGWVETSAHANTIQFYGRTTYLPSAMKAETMAVVTAIITTPPNSSINIYTDSANLISTYHRFITFPVSSRQSLKFNNYLLWLTLKQYITNNNLTISLFKVKSHSNDISNDMADHLAKLECDLPQPIIINPRSIPSSSGNLTWNNLGIVDKSIRKWGKLYTRQKPSTNF